MPDNSHAGQKTPNTPDWKICETLAVRQNFFDKTLCLKIKIRAANPSPHFFKLRAGEKSSANSPKRNFRKPRGIVALNPRRLCQPL
ncbi:MAG: hypothetical protein DBX55_02965 [Verrucomicrobia bacterium]|nr:MAG: hypothetical protein DBX55_02965 [Verrucomicrobiota bacterium]